MAMDPNMIPYIFLIGIPLVLHWFIVCSLTGRITPLIIYVVFLILLFVLISTGLYIDLRNNVGMYIVSDWDNFPYWNFFEFTFGCSFFFASLIVIPCSSMIMMMKNDNENNLEIKHD